VPSPSPRFTYQQYLAHTKKKCWLLHSQQTAPHRSRTYQQGSPIYHSLLTTSDCAPRTSSVLLACENSIYDDYVPASRRGQACLPRQQTSTEAARTTERPEAPRVLDHTSRLPRASYQSKKAPFRVASATTVTFVMLALIRTMDLGKLPPQIIISSGPC
jgi:hypothetical protein